MRNLIQRKGAKPNFLLSGLLASMGYIQPVIHTMARQAYLDGNIFDYNSLLFATNIRTFLLLPCVSQQATTTGQFRPTGENVMKLETLKHGFDHTTMPAHPLADYWPADVVKSLAHRHWARAEVRSRIDLAAWQGYLADLPRDPYVNLRWKRMSWLTLNEANDVEDMGECPMAQGGAFNDAASMADRLRYYAPLTREFMSRPDVKAFVRAWARLWNIGPREPILMQITGVRGEGCVDPLQGQGIHADGCKALSIMVLNRENVAGAENHLYRDKEGRHSLLDANLDPGDILHLRDDRVFHSVNGIRQCDTAAPFERFIIIINSRFVDEFQNRILRRHFPEAVLNETR